MKRDSSVRYHLKNERAKYSYRAHMRRALKKDEKTLLAALKHLREFEQFTGFEDFARFNDRVADKYVQCLMDEGKSLSHIGDNLRSLKEFLRWLERQKGYKRSLNYNHIDYLNISDNQRRTAKASQYKRSYTYPQILATIRAMPHRTPTDKRNRAMISLQALCGLRISELRTVKLKNLIEEDGHYFIYVNPKDMSVKYAKIRHANFMPLPGDIVEHVLTWRDDLRKQGFTDKDPFFPKISSSFSQANLFETRLTHDEIRSNTTIKNIFQAAFAAAGHEYLRVHSFRHTIVRFAERQSPEFLNAVRQALGHSSIDTTFQSYGALSEHDQRERIAGLRLEW